jgi:glutamate-1-semialdehyde 2,1-aminomutase
MEKLSPLGPVYQAGTLSGNPVAVTAGLWVLKNLKKSVSEKINRSAEKFYAKLRTGIIKYALPVQLTTRGSMFTIFFTADPVMDYASAKKSDTKRFAQYFHQCLKAGIYLSPSQYEANFIGLAHTSADLNKASRIILNSLRRVF